MPLKKEIRAEFIKKLSFLYGSGEADRIFDGINDIINFYRPLIYKLSNNVERTKFRENDIAFTTYGDQVSSENEKTLKVLNKFLGNYVSGLIKIVHILPFYPYSSDDGFSVIDYKEVKKENGGWEDIASMGKNFNLMFDAVINHISAESGWFRKYLSGEKAFKDFFIETDPSLDLSGVTRPRTLPLLTEFNTSCGEKWLWTTFSSDQVDLNYASPETLLAIIDVLLFYVSQGARALRLDAIAYLWKKPGTKCVHLAETHELIKLLRLILDETAPYVSIITETNVPHKDNISYFGKNGDEAQMVYNFSLPPLLAHAILRENSSFLSSWASSLEAPSSGNAYFNFTASHDGIGVTPATGLLPPEEVDFLCKTTLARGGNISSKKNAGGTESPYELNINYLSLLKAQDDSTDTAAAKFMVSQAIMLSMPGVPCVYFHSLAGSLNFTEGVKASGAFRAINREKLDFETLVKELSEEDSLRRKVYTRYRELLTIRAGEKAFSPHASFSFPLLSRSVFTVLRDFDKNDRPLIALHNLSSGPVKISLKSIFEMYGNFHLFDLLSRKSVMPDEKYELLISHWQILWLKCTKPSS